MPDANLVEFDDVDAVADTGLALICVIKGRRVAVPSNVIEPGSTVHRAGDRGRLIIPVWIARNLGLV